VLKDEWNGVSTSLRGVGMQRKSVRFVERCNCYKRQEGDEGG